MDALNVTSILIGVALALFTIVLTYFKIIKIRKEAQKEKTKSQDVEKRLIQVNEKGHNKAQMKPSKSLEGVQKNKEGDNTYIES